MKKILLLGSTGKMGIALNYIFNDNNFNTINKNSKDFDAADFKSVKRLIEDNPVDIVMNTVAMMGIDVCEENSKRAFKINALYPKLLAQLSRKYGFTLIHFSTDAVFDGNKQDYYIETDEPNPVNIYGTAKSNGDYYIEHTAKYYIFRIPILFGGVRKKSQFVDKMLVRIKHGEKILRVANDIISSPTYSKDVAKRIYWVIKHDFPYGIYHIANEGKASLYDLMKEIIKVKGLKTKVMPVSYKAFSYIGQKNLYTPLKSCKLPPLRNWREAVKECYGR